MYDGRLWVFGGWKNRSTDALNDVWYSSDGMSCGRQTDHAPWAPRSPISVVFHDKIWIYSGKHTGFDDNWCGDLWQMITPHDATWLRGPRYWLGADSLSDPDSQIDHSTDAIGRR